MSYFRNGDPLDDFDRKDKAESDWLETLPHCCRCGEAIQEPTLYNVFGDIYCAECMNEQFKQNNPNL